MGKTGLELLGAKMNELASSIEDLNEQRRSHASAGRDQDLTGVKSLAKIMLSKIDESMAFFRRQTEIIGEISPHVSEDLESKIEECDELRETIKSKFEDLIDAGETDMSPRVLDVLDDDIKDVVAAQESVLKYVMFAHKCFAGAWILVAQDDYTILDARTKQPKRSSTKS